MNKESIICFRTSRSLHDSLVRAAKKDRRSLSAFIETILIHSMQKKKALEKAGFERRRHSRKPLTVPAVIHPANRGQMTLGIIEEISLGGVGFILPKDHLHPFSIDAPNMRFEIVFNLPPETKPIRLVCETMRAVDTENGLRIGALFVDADFKSYQGVQAYLM
jgi:hypothetical protein